MEKDKIGTMKKAVLYGSILLFCLLAGVALPEITQETANSTALITSLTLPIMFLIAQETFYDNALEDNSNKILMKILAALFFPIGIIVTLGIAVDTKLAIGEKIIIDLIMASGFSYDITSVWDISKGKVPKLTSFLPSCLETKAIERPNKIIEGKFKEIEVVENKQKEDQDRMRALKADLDQFMGYCPDIKPQLEHARNYIGELQNARMSLDNLKNRTFKAAVLDQLEQVYEEVKNGVLQNADDIITICIAGQADFDGKLTEKEIQHIEQELKDSEYKLSKLKEALSTIGYSATQRTTEMSNIGIDAAVSAINSFLDNNSPTLGTK